MIDSNEAVAYENGRDAGYAECRNELREIIESMAYEISTYRNPRFYDHSGEIKSIMREFGWKD